MAKSKKIDKASQPASYATEEFASESVPQQGSQKSRKKGGLQQKRNRSKKIRWIKSLSSHRDFIMLV